MKKIIALMMMILGFSCFAQGGMPPGGLPPGGMPPEGMKLNSGKKMSTDELLSKMTRELQLNELQELQVREILKDMEKHEDFNPNKMKSGERPDFEAIKEKMESKKRELTAKFAKVLTEDQLKKWQEESDNWKPEK